MKQTDLTLLATQALATPPPAFLRVSGFNSPFLPKPKTKAKAPFLPTTILTSLSLPFNMFAAKALVRPLPNSRLTP